MVGAVIGDHPRSRGVYSSALTAVLRTLGSSPLARGLHDHDANGRVLPGIIPARAGFTSTTSRERSRCTDHPRSRGVYPEEELDLFLEEGSSPLARGLRRDVPSVPLQDRIIPARAGFTRPDGPSRTAKKDHPRSRGVYGAAFHSGEVSVGSSPLARGLLCGRVRQPLGCRIIPARAGFTRP